MSRWHSVYADDIDETAVERLVSGRRCPESTCYERREAVRILRSRGLTYQQIADRVRVSDRQVSRDLRHLGLVDETLRRRRVSEAQRRRQHIAALIDTGQSSATVGAMFGVSGKTIRNDLAYLRRTITSGQAVAI